MEMEYYLRFKGTREGFLGNKFDLRYFLFEKQSSLSIVQKTIDQVNDRTRTTSTEPLTQTRPSWRSTPEKTETTRRS